MSLMVIRKRWLYVSRALPAGKSRVRVKPGRIGRIRTEMTGTPCALCGSTMYQVVLNRNIEPGPDGLMGRCSRCQARRDLDHEGAWEDVLFRYGLHSAAGKVSGSSDRTLSALWRRSPRSPSSVQTQPTD